jgi:hypothetical protein
MQRRRKRISSNIFDTTIFDNIADRQRNSQGIQDVMAYIARTDPKVRIRNLETEVKKLTKELKKANDELATFEDRVREAIVKEMHELYRPAGVGYLSAESHFKNTGGLDE